MTRWTGRFTISDSATFTISDSVSTSATFTFPTQPSGTIVTARRLTREQWRAVWPMCVRVLGRSEARRQAIEMGIPEEWLR